MVTKDRTSVIDHEFAFCGPMGFDIGALIANLIIAYFAQSGYKDSQTDRSEYKVYILNTITKLWNLFESKFINLWNTEHKGDFCSPKFINDSKLLEGFQKAYLANILTDSVGFAAAKMIR
jgi:5-methylthioribose kinase